MKRRFIEWYSQEIWKELESGKELNDIDIKLTLTILKPLHASWLTDLYDYLISQKGAEIIFNGWQSSGITEAIVKDTKDLKNLDLFVSVDPLEHDECQLNVFRITTLYRHQRKALHISLRKRSASDRGIRWWVGIWWRYQYFRNRTW